MFQSKFFTVVIVLTFLALGAAVTFQVLEMIDYDHFTSLQQRFFPSK